MSKQDELLPEDAIAELGNELTLDELKERVDEFGGGKFVELHYRGHLAFGLLVIQMTDGESKQAVVNEIVGKLNASRPTPSDEVKQLEEDAARYQWLRDKDLSTIDGGGVFAGMTPYNYVLNGAELDTAIDDEMSDAALSQEEA